MKAALAFLQYGPYHHARASRLRQALEAGDDLVLVQVAAQSGTYAWETHAGPNSEMVTLCAGKEDDATFAAVFTAAWKFWRREKIEVALLPSYSPAPPLALLLSARLCGVRCVMMNDSHAGTQKAKGAKRMLKRIFVSLFHAGLVAGTPQKRHFATLGMPPERIFLGYDAVDNDFFVQASAQVRALPGDARKQLGLPQRYFLSLGRFVPKKDLPTLVRAYARFCETSPEPVALVMVGSGPEEESLRFLAVRLGLAVAGNATVEDSASCSEHRSVYFMGFRQVQENPVFYALAEAFILPSAYEEWGLVVNEAMACGLPVLVSKTVGCAEDLVVDGVNGWLFDSGDVAALAGQLERMAQDPQLRRRMGQASSVLIRSWGCDHFAENAVKAMKLALGGPSVVF